MFSLVRQCYLQNAIARITYIASMCQLLIYNHKMELTKFEIRVLQKHYWKQDYKATAAARRICEVEGEGVVSERVAQRWFQLLNSKYLPGSGSYIRDIENIRSFGRKSSKVLVGCQKNSMNHTSPD